MSEQAKFTPRQRRILVLLSTAVALDIGSVAVVNPALPAIGRALDMDESLLQWVMTGYGITFAGCLLFGGRLADVYSRRLVLAIGVSVFGVGALAATVAPTALVLISARAVQGIGAALSVPAALALVFQIFAAGPLRNRALGTYTSVGAASFGTGLVLGGVLSNAFGWEAVFAFSAVMSAIVLAGIAVLLPGSTGDRRPVDLPGAALITVGLLLAVYAITEAGQGAPPAQTVTAGLLAVALLGGFIGWEARARQPLFSFEILRSRAARAATVGGGVFFFALNGVLFFAPLYMQDLLGYSALQSGLAILPMSVLVVVSSNIAGRLLSRVGQRPVLVIGLLLLAIGVALWMRTPLTGSYLQHILPAIAVMAVGQGLAYTSLTAASLTDVPDELHGVAGALNVTAQQIGASLGVALLAALVSVFAASSMPGDRLAAYHEIYLVITASLIVGATLCAALYGRAVPRSRAG